MPTYDYRCDACGHEFEEFQSITASPLKKCPQCGKAKLKRLIGTGAGIIFKGSGFYETDYRSDSYKNAAKADSQKSSPKTDAKSDGASKSDGAKSDSPKADAPAKKSEPAAASSSKPASKGSKKKD